MMLRPQNDKSTAVRHIKNAFYFLLRLINAVLLLVLVLSAKDSFALDPDKAISQYVQNSWRMEEGLPHNTVRAILQTRDGYLWLGTLGGLARFDGARFTIFDNHNSSFIDNDIRSLCEDRDGTLWIGTRSGGLVRYKQGKFELLTTKEGLSYDTVKTIFALPDGSVWIGTGNGLNLWKDGKLTIYTTKDGLAGNDINHISKGSNDSILIGSNGGVTRLKDGKFSTIATKDNLADKNVLSVLEDKQGWIWIGTSIGGLYCLKEGRFITYTEKDGMTQTRLDAFHEDRDGNIWIGTYGGGLFRFSKGELTDYTMKEGFLDRRVLTFCEDREGSLWIGTFAGLARLKDGVFTTYSSTEGLSDDVTRCVYEDKDGSLWICTNTAGVNHFKDGKFTAYTMKEGLANNEVWGVMRDRRGNLWVGTRGGLNLFKDGKFKTYTTKDRLTGDHIKALYEDRKGNYWIMSGNDGVTLYKNGVLSHLTTKQGLSNNIMEMISEDSTGAIWLGTQEGGVNRIKDDTITVFKVKAGKANEGVRSFYEDREGNLWFGTMGEGLVLLKDGKLTGVTMKEGLFDDSIWGILEDEQGYFWMSCNKGIFRVSRKSLLDAIEGRSRKVFSEIFGTADGIKNPECNGGGYLNSLKTKDGRLWFPTTHGVVVVDPSNLRKNTMPPPVVVEEVLVDNQNVGFADLVQIPAGKRNFEIYYAGLSFVNPARVYFKYKLEGYDQNWIDAGTRRVAYYSNLPPGTYRFRVIASNNDGVWNETGATIEFYLQPHFYQRNWFYALCVFVIAALIAVIYGLRVRQLTLRERRLTKLVEERTQQLEAANEKLQQIASMDGLTNIPNHRRFKEFLEQEWRRAMRQQSHVSLLLMDIDYFKAYNDTYGHQGGDECLKTVASVLRETVNRSTDIVARYGGEEFAVVLANTGLDGASALAEIIRSTIEGLKIPHTGSKSSKCLTVSIGIATKIPEIDSIPDGIITAADKALYRAKESGRNQCCVAQSETQNETNEIEKTKSGHFPFSV